MIFTILAIHNFSEIHCLSAPPFNCEQLEERAGTWLDSLDSPNLWYALGHGDLQSRDWHFLYDSHIGWIMQNHAAKRIMLLRTQTINLFLRHYSSISHCSSLSQLLLNLLLIKVHSKPCCMVSFTELPGACNMCPLNEGMLQHLLMTSPRGEEP